VVFNTLFVLSSQDEQVLCFQNVARHLTEGGVFAIGAFVPDMTRFVRGQNIQTNQVETDRVILDVGRHDPVQQRVVSQHVEITEVGTRLYPAQIDGLRLRERWSDWQRSPFTSASTTHVSVYKKE
jgi:hypothetical protein